MSTKDLMKLMFTRPKFRIPIGSEFTGGKLKVASISIEDFINKKRVFVTKPSSFVSHVALFLPQSQVAHGQNRISWKAMVLPNFNWANENLRRTENGFSMVFQTGFS